MRNFSQKYPVNFVSLATCDAHLQYKLDHIKRKREGEEEREPEEGKVIQAAGQKGHHRSQPELYGPLSHITWMQYILQSRLCMVPGGTGVKTVHQIQVASKIMSEHCPSILASPY